MKEPSHLFDSSREGKGRGAIDFDEREKIDEEASKALMRAALALKQGLGPPQIKRTSPVGIESRIRSNRSRYIAYAVEVATLDYAFTQAQPLTAVSPLDAVERIERFEVASFIREARSLSSDPQVEQQALNGLLSHNWERPRSDRSPKKASALVQGLAAVCSA